MKFRKQPLKIGGNDRGVFASFPQTQKGGNDKSFPISTRPHRFICCRQLDTMEITSPDVFRPVRPLSLKCSKSYSSIFTRTAKTIHYIIHMKLLIILLLYISLSVPYRALAIPLLYHKRSLSVLLPFFYRSLSVLLPFFYRSFTVLLPFRFSVPLT